MQVFRIFIGILPEVVKDYVKEICVMEFYLITTDHMAERLWFLDDEDFKAGMNYVALISSLQGIKILSFILMSNHVHFVVRRRRRGEVQRSRWKSGGAGRSEGADFCKFAGTVNRYGGSCGRLVEAFGNSRGFDRQAFFRRHLAFRRPGEFYGCLLCRSIEGVEV